MDKSMEVRFLITPITQEEINGTVYVAYGYFSPEAQETLTDKMKRLILKEIEQKDGKIIGNS